MFTVNLYTFTKKVDSTKQPTGTGTQYSCNILTPADITAPAVEIKAASDLTGYNYAYISAFHRYYFIEGVTYDMGIWVLSLKCDVLATYKTQIGGESLYVLRAASSYDGDIVDNYYPIINDIVQHSETDSGHSYAYDSGIFVISIAGTESSGNSTLYQLTPGNFKTLIKELYDAIDGFQLADVVKSICKTFGGNPEKLLNGAMWFPSNFVPDNVAAAAVKIGSWSSTALGKVITNPGLVLPTATFTIAAHPQVTKGRYLNLSPYSKYQLFLPGIGLITLDTTELENINSIAVLRTVDGLTGKLLYRVITQPGSGNTNDSILLFAGETQWGVPISLGGNNIGTNLATGMLATAGTVAAAIATGGAAAIIGAAAGGIGTALSAMEGASAGSCVGGSLASHFYPMRLETTFYKITSWDDTHNGRPLMQVKTISSLSGFVMVQKGDVPIPGTSAEAEQIKAFLEGGFFYE